MLSQYLTLVDTDYDRDKLEYLYNTYYTLMFSVAMKYLHTEDGAKDAVHDSILKAIRYLHLIDKESPSKTKTLLCTIVKNRCIDLIRRADALPMGDIEEIFTETTDAVTTPIEYLLQEEGYHFLLSCIEELSDAYRIVCQLKYVVGCRETEIAELLGIPSKTVNTRLFRARRILKNKIKEASYETE